jgi:hypothetical protein
MSKGDELKLEGGAAAKAERECGNDGEKNRIHAYDCMAAAQKSLGLPDIWSFDAGTSDERGCLLGKMRTALRHRKRSWRPSGVALKRSASKRPSAGS